MSFATGRRFGNFGCARNRAAALTLARSDRWSSQIVRALPPWHFKARRSVPEPILNIHPAMRARLCIPPNSLIASRPRAASPPTVTPVRIMAASCGTRRTRWCGTDRWGHTGLTPPNFRQEQRLPRPPRLRLRRATGCNRSSHTAARAPRLTRTSPDRTRGRADAMSSRRI
jgi:hypothetical protein